MDLCIVFGLKFQPPGGAERVVAEEASRAAAAGNDVTVLTKQIATAYRELFADRERVTLREYRNGNQIVHEPLRIRRVFREINPDFVFAHYQDEGVYLATRTLPDSIPYSCHVHGSPLWLTEPDRIVPHRRSDIYDRLVAEVPGHGQFTDDTPLSTKYRVLGEIGEFLRKRALHRAAFVSTGSERVARELSGLYDVDAQVIRPGVSMAWIEGATDHDLISPENWEEMILSVSRLDERKRIPLLIRAVARLRGERGRDVGLVICGTGTHEPTLRALVDDLGVDEAVRFAGHVPDEDLPRYYRSADVFACPAWMSYGLSPIEAYALGTPVVLSTDTYAKEVLDDKPDTTIADPTVAAWTTALAGALNTKSSPDPEVVPTWEMYVNRKLELVERHSFS